MINRRSQLSGAEVEWMGDNFEYEPFFNCFSCACCCRKPSSQLEGLLDFEEGDPIEFDDVFIDENLQVDLKKSFHDEVSLMEFQGFFMFKYKKSAEEAKDWFEKMPKNENGLIKLEAKA